MKKNEKVYVIGAGLAGSECAWALAENGIKVTLIEQKPVNFSPAHKSANFAELVCSNSLKASRLESAAGLLKEEMRRLGSLTMQAAEISKVPAGGALAVDRDIFSSFITEKIKSNKNIEIEYKEETSIKNDGYVVIATGPLTSEKLSNEIANLTGSEGLHFYDAAAPIISSESIDKSKVFTASRYDRGGEDDYINCPMDKNEYEKFYNELIHAQRAIVHDFDVYEGCMPVEVLASRGADAIRFGPLKPVGLVNPKTGHRPWANVQLRKENVESTMYNIVGFQTNLKFSEQKRVFSLIPGLENAEFLRYGVMHRNTFIDSPKLLDKYLRLKKNPNIFFAGQITGVEGYTESAATGIIVGLNIARLIKGEALINLDKETMLGSLCNYVSDTTVTNFQPMGANMGILPTLDENIREKEIKYRKLAERALKHYENLY